MATSKLTCSLETGSLLSFFRDIFLNIEFWVDSPLPTLQHFKDLVPLSSDLC